jgi:glycosyltransferase involved in cell wall biosynthesis
MKEGTIIVNSTLATQRLLSPGEAPPPFHHWGLNPGSEDRLIGHSLGRWAIHMRRLFRGTDPSVARSVRAALAEGYRRIYLVTQPDLIRKLPSLRKAYPDVRIVTWAWVAKEVADWRDGLAACDRIFTLTPAAQAAAEAAFGKEKAELEVVGSDSGRYFLDDQPRHDVGIVGLANRDAATTLKAIAASDFSIVATARTAAWLGQGSPRVRFVDAPGYLDAFKLVASCRVCWIPTHPGDLYPTGLTNLVDALLSGVSVVLSRTSPLPPQVLNLPGVHRYTPGDPEDLVRATREALSSGLHRPQIRRAAAPVLDIRRLEEKLRTALRLPQRTYTRFF